MEIWINPDCSKCRAALSILDAENAGYTVRRYLDAPPTASEIRDVLDRLGLDPWDITRTGESAAARLELDAWPRTPENRDRWIQALADNPILIQRPIITTDDGHAVVARTEEAVRSTLT